jgi:hypothetical protein
VRVAGGGAFAVCSRVQAACRGYSGEAQEVEIAGGSTTRAIGEKLVDAGIVRDMVTYRGGQSLTGAYASPSITPSPGRITLAFDSASTATLTSPGGVTPLTRFPVGSGSGSPIENGRWWNAAEPGRGFSIEMQGGAIFIAGFMYDTAGNPLWYFAQGAVGGTGAYSGAWLQAAGGQTLGGAYRPPTFYESAFKSASISGELGPEKLQMYEAIWLQSLGKGFALNSSLFYYHVQHLIDAVSLFEYINLADVEAKGVEVSLDARPTQGTHGYLNYTFQHAHQSGSQMTNSPSQMVKTGLGADLFRVTTAAVELRYESSRITPQGTTTDGFVIATF